MPIAATLATLVREAEQLTRATVQGKFDARGNSDLVGFEFRPILAGMNAAFDAIVNFIDRIPSPVLTVDRDYNIHYMNAAGCSD